MSIQQQVEHYRNKLLQKVGRWTLWFHTAGLILPLDKQEVSCIITTFNYADILQGESLKQKCNTDVLQKDFFSHKQRGAKYTEVRVIGTLKLDCEISQLAQ